MFTVLRWGAPSKPASRHPERLSAVSRSVLDGIVPVWTQTPPTRRPFSITSTDFFKKSVLVIEKGRRVGGVCVHTVTIPSKTLRETALNLSGWREAGFEGAPHRNTVNI